MKGLTLSERNAVISLFGFIVDPVESTSSWMNGAEDYQIKEMMECIPSVLKKIEVSYESERNKILMRRL